MQIRALDLERDEDFTTLKRLISRLYSELFGAAEIPSETTFASFRRQAASTKVPHWCFVAEVRTGSETAEVVALCTLAESFALFGKGRYAILGELWVHPEHRGRGVGGRVIEFLKEFARQKGYSRVDVSAPPDPKWDRTVEFYTRQGFVLTGRKLKLLL